MRPGPKALLLVLTFLAPVLAIAAPRPAKTAEITILDINKGPSPRDWQHFLRAPERLRESLLELDALAFSASRDDRAAIEVRGESTIEFSIGRRPAGTARVDSLHDNHRLKRGQVGRCSEGLPKNRQLLVVGRDPNDLVLSVRDQLRWTK